MKKRLLLVVAVTALTPHIARADQAPEAALRAADAFHEALSAKHQDGALALLDSDVLIFESGGVELSKGEYASHHLGADMQFSAAMTRQVIDRQSGRDDATPQYRGRMADYSHSLVVSKQEI